MEKKRPPFLRRKVVKSPADPCDYEYLVYENGFRAVIGAHELPAGTTAERTCGACLLVEAGSHDETVQGLAHFLEHLLFLGSGEYPSENTLEAHLSLHGGDANAETGAATTSYYFTCYPSGVEGALSRMRASLSSPLLAVASMEREIRAIESEFEIARSSDGTRLDQVIAAMCVPGTPASRFQWGNIQSLVTEPALEGVDMGEELKNFFGRHYTPERMTLALHFVGTMEDALRAVESAAFQGLGLASRPYPSSASLPRLPSSTPDSSSCGGGATLPIDTRTERGGFTVAVKFLKEKHRLHLAWMLPPHGKGKVATKPWTSIVAALEHVGTGSLSGLYKSRGWATSVSCAPEISDMGTAGVLFGIRVDLTGEGLREWVAVRDMIHRYMDLLRAEGPQRWLFEEAERVEDALWNHGEHHADRSESVDTLAEMMRSWYELDVPNELLRSTTSLAWLPDDVCTQLALMDRGSACTLIASSSLQEDADLTKILGPTMSSAGRIEAWFGTRYWVVDEGTPDTEALLLDAAGGSAAGRSRESPEGGGPTFALPTRNPFAAASMLPPPVAPEVICAPIRHLVGTSWPCPTLSEPEDAHAAETLLFRSAKQGYPHATLKLAITSRSLPEGAMRCSDAARLSLFVSMLKEAKEEPFLMAALAGTSAEVISTFWGIEVTVSGFESSVLAVASLVRAAIHAVVDDAKEAEDTFLLQREEMVGSLRGACRKPGALASDMIWAARSQASHRSRELCSSLEALTYAEFRAWADDFVREAGVRCGLWVGASGSTSAAILAVVAFGDGSEARAPLPMPTPSTTLCPGHATVVYGRTSEVSNNNRTVQLVFDWGASADPEALATLRLVVECVEEGASEELRTRQQLGYEVILGVEESGDRLYLTLRVQSHDVEPAHLLCHMLAFLREGVPELFAEMDEEDFADRKTSVAESFLECPSMCRHTAEHWWESIERSIQGGRMTDSTVNFQWKKEAADAVEAATATALLAVYLSRTAASRGAACVVAVAVGGGGCPEEGAHRPLEPLWAALEREGFVAELRADRTVEPAADATLIGGCDNADRTVCCSICSIRWGDEVGPSGEGELHVH